MTNRNSQRYFEETEQGETEHSFSLIADYDGNDDGLFNTEIEEYLPVLPLRNMVLFPSVVLPVSVGRRSSLRLVQEAVKKSRPIAVFCQKSPDIDEPGFSDLYQTGTMARVLRILKMPDQTTTVILQGTQRIKLLEIHSDKPYLVGRIEAFPEVLPDPKSEEFKAVVDSCKDMAVKYIKHSDIIQPDAAFALRNISNGVFLIDFICANLPLDIKEKIRLLREPTMQDRAFRLLSILNREVQLADLKAAIQMRTREDIDKQQKEYFLQQQLKNIQDEIGRASCRERV